MALPLFENEKVQGILNHSLRNHEFMTVIEKRYHSLLLSNYGPKSGSVIIRNSAGSDSYTSSSSVMMQQLQFCHPLFKFINALINAQNQSYGAHGLYVGLLCSGLLYRFLWLEEQTSFRIIKEASDQIINTLMSELQQHTKEILFNLDWSSTSHIFGIAKSIVGSKVCNILSEDEKCHLYLKIALCFVKSIPVESQKDFSHVHILTLDGPSTLKTQVFEGILYREPDISIEDLNMILNKLPKSNLKMVVFNIPLSSDLEEKRSVEWTGPEQMEVSFNEFTANHLCRLLKEKGIHIIANQKYIHSTIKYQLEKAGFIVLERIGMRQVSSLIQICRCHPVTCLSDIETCKQSVGIVDNISAVSIEGRSYLNLFSQNSCESLTIILTGLNCHLVVFLKEAVESCLNILQHSMLRDSSLVVGGGCFEAFVSRLLLKIEADWVSQWAKKMNCSQAKISEIFRVFTETFLQLSVRPSGGNSQCLVDYCIDSSFSHLWLIDESAYVDSSEDEKQQKLQSKSGFSVSRNSNNEILEDANWTASSAGIGNKKSFRMEYRDVSNMLSGTCICKALSKSMLPEVTDFIPLLSLKNCRSNYSCKGVRSDSESVPLPDNLKILTITESAVQFRDACIVDYWPAKLNALRMAFEGFSELFGIGDCVFDQ